jgi:creatinine amidohydrolase
MITAVNHRTYARLTAPQVSADLSERTILCLPVGSLEQHGPHLPINTDTVLAERFAHCLAQYAAERHDVWVAPPLPFGLSPEHAWSAGR